MHIWLVGMKSLLLKHLFIRGVSPGARPPASNTSSGRFSANHPCQLSSKRSFLVSYRARCEMRDARLSRCQTHTEKAPSSCRAFIRFVKPPQTRCICRRQVVMLQIHPIPARIFAGRSWCLLHCRKPFDLTSCRHFSHALEHSECE
jgi:hypothetical protein